MFPFQPLKCDGSFPPLRLFSKHLMACITLARNPLLSSAAGGKRLSLALGLARASDQHSVTKILLAVSAPFEAPLTTSCCLCHLHRKQQHHQHQGRTFH